MNRLNLFVLCIWVLLATSCNLRETAKLKENLPKAKGRPGDILIVMDSAQWLGATGSAVKGVFNELVDGLPRNEPLFTLQYIDPLYFQSVFKLQKNIIFVTILKDKSPGNRKLRTYFTEASRQMINENPALYMYTKEDDFARGQHILHLFGNTPEQLIENIEKGKSALQQHFLEIEKKRLYAALYNAKPIEGIKNHLEKKFSCSMSIPYGYDIGLDEDQFIWIRSYSRDVDKNIFITYVDYTSKELFSLDSLISIRERTSRPYVLYKPEDPDSYMLTEKKHMDVIKEQVSFRGEFAIRLRGLWKLNKYTMGGPFISYAHVDEELNRLYYIEGFLYSPGIDQRDYMRELDVILSTFKKSNQF